MKIDHYITSHRKINSKLIKYLNIRTKTVKLIEENIGIHIHKLGLDNGFLHRTPKV